jgi:hypothetical protein
MSVRHAFINACKTPTEQCPVLVFCNWPSCPYCKKPGKPLNLDRDSLHELTAALWPG